MAYFYVNKNAQPTGEHEVHTMGCPTPPDEINRVRIGDFATCHEALRAVRATNPTLKFDGCYYCCPSCHTR